MQVAWEEFAGPTDYRPRAAEQAAAVLANDEVSPERHARAVGELCGAVSNDHAGTLFPAAVPATSVLVQAATRHPGLPREEALATLIDWCDFEPEPLPGDAQDLKADFATNLRSALDDLVDVAADRQDGGDGPRLARKLLRILR